ncbi:MAG: glutathione peroxidase [Proteobacteria bacterium]|jgi:glutathione peroxidase|nr:glutathione peroxidase [Pseudomonadota bacterium]
MKNQITHSFFLLFVMILSGSTFAESNSIYSLKVKNFDGSVRELAQYRGKVTLIVNTASQCGFTPQLKSLQTLQEEYGSQGFQILAFPSNDFKQDAGDSQKFASDNYKVTFPLMEKGPVTGNQIQPVFAFLTKSYPAIPQSVLWNFEKFLVDKNGIVRARYRSLTDPTEKSVRKEIEKLLAEKTP